MLFLGQGSPTLVHTHEIRSMFRYTSIHSVPVSVHGRLEFTAKSEVGHIHVLVHGKAICAYNAYVCKW